MLNFQNLKNVEKVAGKQEETKVQSAGDSYNRAIVYIKKFNTDQNFKSKYLLEAAKHLSLAVKLKKNIPEPYFLLSYIFYLMNKGDLSIKYLKIAREIKPEMPGITQMQQLLTNPGSPSLSQNMKKIKIEVVNHEFNGQIKVVTSLGTKMGARLKNKGAGSFEFNNETKVVTKLGKKIQRVSRLKMGDK